MAKVASNRPAQAAPDEWEVKDAADTIHRAHKHLKNKKLMKHVRKHVKSQAKAMSSLAQALGGGGQPQSVDEAFGP